MKGCETLKKDRQYTIGLLVSGIMDTFTVSICQGVIKAAKELGIKLIIFPGKYLDRDFTERKEIFYEYQYNIVFSYAQKEHLDALLVSANTIGCFATHERVQELLNRYAGIPCILLSSYMDGYLSVNFDNNSGIREAVNYLAQNLKYTKIGMIGGPDNNSDALERKKAFLQALAENGLTLMDHRYIEGDLSRYCLNTFRTFLNHNPDLEAVFCVNDDTAIGLYEVLQERNLSAGTHLSIFGYDNIPYATHMEPPLSSVWADPVMLGETATQMAYRILEGETVESQILSTRFIKRASLGDKKTKTDSIPQPFDENYIDTIFDDIFYRYHNKQNGAEYHYVVKSFKQLMSLLLSAYKHNLLDDQILQQILDINNTLIHHNALDYIDIERFIEHIENINVATRYTHTDISSAVYRKIIPALKQQYGRMMEQQEEQKYALMLFVKDTMSFENGNDESYAVLLKHINWLNIRNASIYTFEKPIIHPPKTPFHLPEKLYLKASLKNGIAESVPTFEQEISSDRIYSNPYVRDDLPQVLFPLYSNETVYGLLLCDMSDKLYDHGDFLVNQISSAIKMIYLLKCNDDIQRQLESSLETLKESNLALDHLSKYDVLTGIFNRRGFLDVAETTLQHNNEQHIDTLVAYIDMNNLKLVNDKYGHDEGDYSIKKIAEILGEITTENGIAGRMGGDEFVLMMAYQKEYDIVSEIYNRFEAFNQTGAKPYEISVSAGTCCICANQPLTLSVALTQADELLYEEKKKRKAKQG